MSDIKSIRLSSETQAKIADLGRIWGPVKALTFADVIRECVDRIHNTETKKREKRK